MKPQGVTFIYKEIFMKGLTKMDATISTVIIIIAALSTAGVVNTIGFSTSVQAQATHFEGGTCTGSNKACAKNSISRWYRIL
jgi:hypothetical protein